MVKDTVAVMTPVGPGGIQSKHRLVPILIIPQFSWQACDVTFGQCFELGQHSPPQIDRAETVHPEHDPDLNLQGEYMTKG